MLSKAEREHSTSEINATLYGNGFWQVDRSTLHTEKFDGKVWRDGNGIEFLVLEDEDVWQITVYLPLHPVDMAAANPHWGFAALDGACGKSYCIEYEAADISTILLKDIESARNLLSFVQNGISQSFLTIHERDEIQHAVLGNFTAGMAAWVSAPYIASAINQAIDASLSFGTTVSESLHHLLDGKALSDNDVIPQMVATGLIGFVIEIMRGAAHANLLMKEVQKRKR